MLACLCCLLVALPASGKEARKQNPYERAIGVARSEIWKEITGGKCGSATAAIMVEGRLVYAEGFGMADRQRSIPVDRATLFNMGSIGKVYVAAAIMLLVDDGKVALDKPVTDYLPEFTMADDRYRQITVRMTLNHTSGLPGTEGANSFGFAYDDRVKRETLETLARARLKHAPGAMAVYCNDGFTLAELIVERVSGRKYLDFLHARIFKPLGLKNTAIGVGAVKGKPIALYYDPKTGKKHPPETLSILGAGGLSATAEELCRFADAFSANGRLFKRASLAEMKRAQPSSFRGNLRNPEISFGLGWDMTGLPRYEAAGVQVLGKSGGTGNYASMLYTVPDKRISVAVIGAGRETGAMRIALEMLDAVLVDRKLVPGQEKPLALPPVAQKVPPEHLSFEGYYAAGGKLGQFVFDQEKNSVSFSLLKGREKVPALALVYADGSYHDAAGGRSYFTALDGEGYFVNSVASVGLDMIAMQRVKPVDKPQSLRIDMDGRSWLRRNVRPSESVMAVDSHFEKSWLYKDLPGYVFFGGIKRIESPEFAGMPLSAMRDQTELTLFEKEGAVWARVSDLLFSPAEGAAALQAGENSLKIGSDGYTEWLRADEEMIVSFVRPEQGRIILFSPDDTATYDSALDTGDAYAAQGSYLEFAGGAGDVFIVTARPRAAAERDKPKEPRR